MIKYVDDVLGGKVVANKKIKLACQRFKDNLKRSKSDDFNFYYDDKQARKAIAFMEQLPKTDGGKLKLQPFQQWIISELYGWREKSTGNRMYTQAFISMSRKNSKTFLASGIGAIGLLMESKPAMNRDVLFVSNALKQAKLGYDMLSSGLRQVCKQSAYMKQRLLIQKQAITDLESNSKAKALASDTSTLDGYAGTTIILDEYHQATNRKVYDVLRSGQIQQPNGLMAIISTAGLNLNCPMYQDYKLYTKVLNGKEKAPRTFIAIWELDDKEEVYNQKNWIKANPLMSEPNVKKTMTEAIQADVDLATKQDNLIPVLVKNFNMWQQASENSYISASDWEKTSIDEPNLMNKEVYFGVDLSKSNDLTAVSWLVPTGNGHFYCDSHSWIGTKYGLDSKIKRDGIDYRSMERAGECTITKLSSGIIDYDEVFDYIQSLIGKYNWTVKFIAYDPYNFDNLLTKFDKANYPMYEVRQGTKTLNIPTRAFREELFAGNIQHGKNKILSYAVNNAILKIINNGWQIDKARNTNRIDPIAALMNAYVAGMNYYDEAQDTHQTNEYYSSDDFGF